MTRCCCIGLAFLFWLWLTGFSSAGGFQTPAGGQNVSTQLGLSLSGSMVPCMGCASNSDESCFLWGGDLWFGFRVHDAGSLRLRLSVLDGAATRGDGDHHDFSGNLYLGASAEYMLSNRSSRLALLVGTTLNIWKHNNREDIELLAVIPYLGGILAFGDPDLTRPYLTARLGASVHPNLVPYASLSAGLQIPLRNDLRMMTELIATISPGGDGLLPSLGVGIGLVF